MAPGDALCLYGLTPHFSKPNEGPLQRRVMVSSYTPFRDQYTRDSYYSARDASMRRSSANGRDRRISTIADFEGLRSNRGVVEAIGHCTHN
jgi:hypothetical protein